MADVARLPGLFEQIWLVAGLRWRILRNNMKNKNRVWDVIGVVISSVVGIVFVAGIAILVFVGTVAFLNDRHEARFGLLFWGFFLWWQVLPIFVAGFSPSFSFRSLLRFPLKFSAFYSIGLAYGLADSAALASLVRGIPCARQEARSFVARNRYAVCCRSGASSVGGQTSHLERTRRKR